MGGDGTPPSSLSRKRRQRSSEEDGGAEEESKARRHHHHDRRDQGHRHHRRSHGKQGRAEGELPQEEAEVWEGERLAVDAVGVSVMDVEEREEGEIFDDEDGVCDRAHLSSNNKFVKTGICKEGIFQADEITKECAALNVGKVRGELMNHPLSVGELKKETCFLSDGKFGHGDEEYRMAYHDETLMSKPRSQPEVSQFDKENEKEVPSGSHGFRGSELSTKRKREDKIDLNGHKERKHSESLDSYRKFYYNRERSASPESYNENSKTRGKSPSYGKYHDKEKCRHRPGSASHLRERSQDLDCQTSRAISSDSRDSIRSYSDCERGALYDKQDRRKIQSQEVDYERDKLYRVRRECSVSSLGRHDRREAKYGSPDRNRKRARERSRDRKIDKGRERVRDRSRDKDRDHVKIREVGRENERARIRTRERVGDKERIRDDKDREGSSIRRGRASHRVRNRDVDRQEERDRVRIHNSRVEPQCSRFDEPELYKDNARSNSAKHNHEDLREKISTREEDEEYYQEKIEQQLARKEEDDPKKIIEESRRRRQAILEKYKKQQSQKHSEPPADTEEEEENTSVAANNNLTVDASQVVAPKGSTSEQNSPDMKFSIGKSPLQNGVIPDKAAGGLGYGSPKSERSADMFCDDIFGESPAGIRVTGKEAHLTVERTAAHDNWDDAEGYYSYRLGEVLDGRYEIIAALGKGVFSTVVRAKDLKAGKDEPEVAIKIIRNNDTMYKAGLEELTILKKIAGADPGDKRHCVRFISSFKYRNHLCLVFETLHMNLREVLKKFGRNIGLKLTAVRAYAKQLFIALKHLRSCGVLHCDIKPDNMLVNEAKNVLKLCDFGNAMFAGKNEITPYLVSRFYRSPEIILGLPYDHPMDMWSVGCCLFELYNGKVLCPGPSNNEMLRLHMELKGPFPKKMLRKGAFTNQHFDHDLNFLATEEDPVTKKPVKRLLLNIKPKDMGTILTSFPEEDPKMLAHFKDLLERIFILDPDKRLTVTQALSHPFITGK